MATYTLSRLAATTAELADIDDSNGADFVPTSLEGCTVVKGKTAAKAQAIVSIPRAVRNAVASASVARAAAKIEDADLLAETVAQYGKATLAGGMGYTLALRHIQIAANIPLPFNVNAQGMADRREWRAVGVALAERATATSPKTGKPTTDAAAAARALALHEMITADAAARHSAMLAEKAAQKAQQPQLEMTETTE